MEPNVELSTFISLRLSSAYTHPPVTQENMDTRELRIARGYLPACEADRLSSLTILRQSTLTTRGSTIRFLHLRTRRLPRLHLVPHLLLRSGPRMEQSERSKRSRREPNCKTVSANFDQRLGSSLTCGLRAVLGTTQAPIEFHAYRVCRLSSPKKNNRSAAQSTALWPFVGLQAVRQGRPGLGTGQADLGVSLKARPSLA